MLSTPCGITVCLCVIWHARMAWAHHVTPFSPPNCWTTEKYWNSWEFFSRGTYFSRMGLVQSPFLKNLAIREILLHCLEKKKTTAIKVSLLLLGHRKMWIPMITVGQKSSSDPNQKFPTGHLAISGCGILIKKFPTGHLAISGCGILIKISHRTFGHLWVWHSTLLHLFCWAPTYHPAAWREVVDKLILSAESQSQWGRRGTCG